MEVITIRKKELINAFRKYNKKVLDNPDAFNEKLDETEETATGQTEQLLEQVTEGHFEEELVEIKGNTISAFINHLKEHGVSVSEDLYESFFKA